MLALALVACIGVVSLWTPFLNPQILARWLAWSAILYVTPVPLLTLAAAARLVLAVHDRRDVELFLATLVPLVLCYIGLGICLFPHIVPPSITIWDAAAAPDKSLAFLLVGSVVLIPIILAYIAYSYWVFRNKVDSEGGYH
ncbi:MAG: cytochrome d ubiquinol oxidase subunit II [Hyphomicrobiaceae bacterium]